MRFARPGWQAAQFAADCAAVVQYLAFGDERRRSWPAPASHPAHAVGGVIEAEYRLTRRCCEILLQRDFQVSLLTKSLLVLRDFDIFAGHDVRVGVTITTLDERMAELWEPGAFSVEQRFRILAEARRAGLSTTIRRRKKPLLQYV